MRRFLFYSAALAMTLLSSCTNSDYDLANIDTNVRLEVKDLTIPVNLEPIKLDKVLDIKDGDRIKNYYGEYAVIEEGTFNSDAINIKPVEIEKPSFPVIDGTLTIKIHDALKNLDPKFDALKLSSAMQYLPEVGPTTELISFTIVPLEKTFEVSSKNMDKHITKVDKIRVNEGTEMFVSLEFESISNIVENYHINNLAIHLPDGLETTNKNYKDGLLFFSQITPDEQGKLKISMPFTSIDAEKAGANINNGEVSFKKNIFAEGEIKLYVGDLEKDVTVGQLKALSKISYKCDAGFTEKITVTTFTGDIDYTVNSPSVNPVNLDNLPEILQQSGTKIVMENPQIYLKVNNPLIGCDIKPTAELTLTPSGVNNSKPFNQTINLSKADNTYCMSPNKPNAFYTGFANAEHQTFGNLGKILACEGGIPEQIAIDVDVKIVQHVENFELKSYGQVSGSYTFYAPLSLTSETNICYEKEWDDWGDEDLDGLTVRSASITADVTSTIPAEIKTETEAILLSSNGKEMKGTTSGLKATSEKQTLTINLSGNEINRIKGLRLKVHAAGGDKSLNDQQEIKIENLKITLSGYYDKEL